MRPTSAPLPLKTPSASSWFIKRASPSSFPVLPKSWFPGRKIPLADVPATTSTLCPQEPEVLRAALSQSLLVDVVPQKDHRRRNAAPVERHHGRLHVLKDGVAFELLSSSVANQERNRILILHHLSGALR